MSRCTGGCCARFYLGPRVALEEKLGIESAGGDKESAFILDMLIPEQGPLLENKPGALYDNQLSYTCKHFDGTNGTVYYQRPEMCRRYPNNAPCPIEGCTYDGPLAHPATYYGSVELMERPGVWLDQPQDFIPVARLFARQGQRERLVGIVDKLKGQGGSP